jgi:hypothetical protein
MLKKKHDGVTMGAWESLVAEQESGMRGPESG